MSVGFTVETDGRLPDGTTLRAAVEAVDEAAPPDWFVVNCAHPSHVAAALADAGPWLERIGGTRVNASALSHAELDAAEELDEGDPAALARDQAGARRVAARRCVSSAAAAAPTPGTSRRCGGSPCATT